MPTPDKTQAWQKLSQLTRDIVPSTEHMPMAPRSAYGMQREAHTVLVGQARSVRAERSHRPAAKQPAANGQAHKDY